MSYSDHLQALRTYLSTGPALDSQADSVILLYQILRELDNSNINEQTSNIYTLLSQIEVNIRALSTTPTVDDLREAFEAAIRGLQPSATIYVSLTGNDENTGYRLAPVRSLSVAIQRAANLNPSINNPVTIKLAPGNYEIVAPLVLPRDISLTADAPNTVLIKPTIATENENLILVDSNSCINNINFTAHQQGSFAISFNNLVNNSSIANTGGLGAYVTRPVLILNSTSMTASVTDGIIIEGIEVELETGGGIEIDGNKCAPNSPVKSMIVHNFNATNYNGTGFLIKNSGKGYFYNCVSHYCKEHYKAESGGQCFIHNSISNNGIKGLVSSGFNNNPEGTGRLTGEVPAIEATNTTVVINNLTVGSKLYKGSLIKVVTTNRTDVYKVLDISGDNGLFEVILDRRLLVTAVNTEVTFHRISKITSNNHFFNHIGSGTDYRALAENNTEDNPNFKITQELEGVVICTSVDAEGNISLNNAINVDGTTGFITFNAPFEFIGLDLEANFQLDPNTSEITQNVTNTPDGVVPRPFSFNPYNFTTEQLKLLTDRITGGSTYQIYVDIDNPNASDAKDNRGNSNLKPYRTLERALIETARRSFAKGNNNDIYNRVSIYVAPGIYRLNNGKGGVINNDSYGRYQDASDLILGNFEYIYNIAYAEIEEGYANNDPIEFKESMKSLVRNIINSLVDDLSSFGNKQTVMLARTFVRASTINENLNYPLSIPAQSDYYSPFIYSLLNINSNGSAPPNNALFSNLQRAIERIREESIKAMRNELDFDNPNIIIDTQTPTCANVASSINNYMDILAKSLVPNVALDNPYERQINVNLGDFIFPNTGEPSSELLQAFNDGETPGIILPRGVSIIGADLRKVLFKPTYVPDPIDDTIPRASIFRMTGGNFFQGFTILDQDERDRSFRAPTSHHKLSAFAFSTEADLELYYNRIADAFTDRTIYNKAQDAANLIKANYDWLIENLTIYTNINNPNTSPDSNFARFYKIFEEQLPYYIQALILDLQQLDKYNVTRFANSFKNRHIDTLASQGFSNERIVTIQNCYVEQINNSFGYFVQAINNLGGVRDYRIIFDTSVTGQCTDVITAIDNYLNIIKQTIKGSIIPPLNAIRFIAGDVEARDPETSIVIPNTATGGPSVNTVQGASPYIFSASVRSEYGMCGIDGDGSLVKGLKSYLAAQFTIISLQKDPQAFTKDGAELEVNPEGRYKGSLLTHFTQTNAHKDWRHFGYRVLNGAYSQLVSCFCICPAVHYWAGSGGEFSITNSTSNFGDVSLYAETYNPKAYPQDSNIQLAGIIKPQDLPDIRNNVESKADKFVLGRVADMENVVGFPNRRIIVINSAGNFLNKYTIDNPDRPTYVYVNGINPERPRRGRVISTQLNDVGRLRITINISDSLDLLQWGEWLLEDRFEDADENISEEVSVIGRDIYFKRYVDTRSPIDREFRLVLRHNFSIETGLNGKRRPVIHYILQKNVDINEPQPFELDINETRTMFYVLNINNIEDDNPFLTLKNNSKYYDLQTATLNANEFGQIETEIDLSFNTQIDLDFDPGDSRIPEALNRSRTYSLKTFSRENIEVILTKLNKTNLLNQLNVNDIRFINLDSLNNSEDIYLDFSKPSVIRCGSQTWEYMGYYNYSTGIPQFQTQVLGDELNDQIRIRNLRVDKTQTSILGGRIYATGMDELGNSYVGNTIIDLKTGQQETIIRGSSDDVVDNLPDIPIPQEFQDITVNGVLTLGSRATFRFATEFFNGETISATLDNFPRATEEQAGIAQIANDQQVSEELSNEVIITPAKLKKWRIDNKLVSSLTRSNNIYVSNRVAGFHSAATSTRNGNNLNNGDVVSWTDFRNNQNNAGADNIPIWQISDPNRPNFRCFGNLEDVAEYIKANFTTNDQVVLFLDPGKYRADYQFNCGVIINGANNLGVSSWGKPDGSDITADGLNGGVILYVTCSVRSDTNRTRNAISLLSNSISINSDSLSSINYVHIWTHITACKDPSLEWSIKSLNENTFEQLLVNANRIMYQNNLLTNELNLRAEYNASWSGYNRARPVIRLNGPGRKELANCTFSGQGVSTPSMDRGGNYNGGYIYILDSCDFILRNIVLRGNEEIRFSDKYGRFVITPGNATAQLIPSGSFKDNPETWQYAPIFDNNGNRLTASNGRDLNVFREGFHTAGCFHDPFTQEFVSIGFTDFFIGIAEKAEVKIQLEGESFRRKLSYYGTIETTLLDSLSLFLNGVITVNNDVHNIRLEKLEENNINLFGTSDDRVYTKQTSELLTGEDKLYFRGTDNLGRKIEELVPPVLTYSAGVVNQSNRTDWETWVQELKEQGPIITTFLRNVTPFNLTQLGEFTLWSDRDSSGLIRGQGFLGEFGYKPTITNYRLSPIRSWEFNSNNYGQTVTWADLGTGCSFVSGSQYHFNFFRPAWKGFTLGKYQHPVIIDIGSQYPNLMTTLASNSNDYSVVASFIEGLTIQRPLAPNPEQLHTLNGKIVGAIFYIVGTGTNDVLPLLYTGYEYSGATKVHKFIRLSVDNVTANNSGLPEYRTARTNNRVYNTLDLLLGANLIVSNNLFYVRECNLFFRRVSNGSSSNNIKSWQPQPLNPSYSVIHNLANMGLFGNIYKTGLFVNKLGYECNTETDFGVLANILDNPELRSGFNADILFSGLEISIRTPNNVTL